MRDRKDLPFENCMFRVLCLSCLSTLTCMFEEMPVFHTRIQMKTECWDIPVEMGFYILHENFTVINFKESKLTHVPFKQLMKFDDNMAHFIDYDQLIPTRILPLNQYGKNMIRLASCPWNVDRYFSSDMCGGYHGCNENRCQIEDCDHENCESSELITNLEQSTENTYLQFLSSRTQVKTYENFKIHKLVHLDFFDKWNNANDIDCKLNGHEMYYTLDDSQRICDKCLHDFRSFEDDQTQRICTITDRLFEMVELYHFC